MNKPKYIFILLLSLFLPTSYGQETKTEKHLAQLNNPINKALSNYKKLLTGKLKDDLKTADNIMSWQFKNGAFFKGSELFYKRRANEAERAANEKKHRFLGCLDNNATTLELMLLADVYKRGLNMRHKLAAQKAFNFLLKSQHKSGGWPQYYPNRSKDSYSNHATFNDNAMMRVMILLQKVHLNEAPFDCDILTKDQRKAAGEAIDIGVDFILKSQIVMNGNKTIWCAQHGMNDYKAKAARSYELASKSGCESVLILAFLMSRPQTPEISSSVKAGLSWFRNPANYMKDSAFDGSKDNPLISKKGSRMWFRFYELKTNKGFFCNRNGVATYEIMEVEKERRNGYAWGGNWPEKLLKYAKSVGY